ncbi:MAG: hypothetical protein HC923_09400 [Myxococcales bacterium]|nr:hypothetical protein [Myxococcales bacterium]
MLATLLAFAVLGADPVSIRTIPFSSEVTMAANDAVVVELVLPKVRGRAVRAEWVHVATPSRLLVLPDEALGRGPKGAVLRYGLVTDGASGSHAVRLVVNLTRGKRILRRLRIRQSIDIQASTPTTEGLDALAEVAAPIERDTPQAPTSLGDLDSVARYVATRKLQSWARRPDALGLESYRRVAGATSATLARSSTGKGATRQAAREAIEAGREEDAQAILRNLRRDRTQSKESLADVLELEGCLQWALGSEAAARRTFTQVLTLFPERATSCPLPWSRSAFDELRSTLKPDRALAIGKIELSPIARQSVQLTVDVGPDPARLAMSVEIESPQLTALGSDRVDLSHAGDVGFAVTEVELSDPDMTLVQLRIRHGTGMASSSPPSERRIR